MGRSTIRRVRRTKAHGRASGFLITWDLNPRDRYAVSSVYRFVFGREGHVDGTTYRYPGCVDKPGVRYRGQSVLLVPADILPRIRNYLNRLRVPNEIIRATIG